MQLKLTTKHSGVQILVERYQQWGVLFFRSTGAHDSFF